jgi:DHA1 family tetracycline resistance protein-like MFS transporter
MSVLTAITFLCYLAHEVYPNVFVLYVVYRFSWDERTIGLSLGAAGICMALVQAMLTRRAVHRLGERGSILVGLAFGSAGFLLYGLAPNAWWFWAAIPLVAPWGIASPALQSLMSRQVSPAEQGRLQGAISSVRGITGLIGPALFTLTFAAFLPGGWASRHAWHVPGAPFVLSGTLIMVALVLAVGLERRTGEAGLTPGEPLAPPPGFSSET